jgi:F-box protein 9
VYPNSTSTEVRARCGIRGVPALGAANRLDIEDLVTFDRDSGSAASMLAAYDPDEALAAGGAAGSVTSFRRGLSPCVFVPWEHVASSPLNLPVRDMDYWMPG